VIRRCRDDELEVVLAIVNEAAAVYRGVIPSDRWHEPYMPADELAAEIAGGVEFWGWVDSHDELVGVMGIQPVQDVWLIRHAYVRSAAQGCGVGGELLSGLTERVGGQLLVGTWATATWAIRFYERHGFVAVPREQIGPLLRRYWSIPERQVETSVVLAKPPLGG
jgi:GNAT superfamily N-acetyltransferase